MDIAPADQAAVDAVWAAYAHTRFFNRQCAAMGLTFSDDTSVVFERFELVWPTSRP